MQTASVSDMTSVGADDLMKSVVLLAAVFSVIGTAVSLAILSVNAHHRERSQILASLVKPVSTPRYALTNCAKMGFTSSADHLILPIRYLPCTAAISRAQHVLVAANSMLLMLFVTLMFYYSKGSICCVEYKEYLNCEAATVDSLCWEMNSCAQLYSARDSGELQPYYLEYRPAYREYFKVPIDPQGYECTAFPQETLMGRVWSTLITLMIIMPISMLFMALFALGGHSAPPAHWRPSRPGKDGAETRNSTWLQVTLYMLLTVMLDMHRLGQALAHLVFMHMYLLRGVTPYLKRYAMKVKLMARQWIHTVWFMRETMLRHRSPESVLQELEMKVEIQEQADRDRASRAVAVVAEGWFEGRGGDIGSWGNSASGQFLTARQESDSLCVQFAYMLLTILWAMTVWVLLTYGMLIRDMLEGKVGLGFKQGKVGLGFKQGKRRVAMKLLAYARLTHVLKSSQDLHWSEWLCKTLSLSLPMLRTTLPMEGLRELAVGKGTAAQQEQRWDSLLHAAEPGAKPAAGAKKLKKRDQLALLKAARADGSAEVELPVERMLGTALPGAAGEGEGAHRLAARAVLEGFGGESDDGRTHKEDTEVVGEEEADALTELQTTGKLIMMDEELVLGSHTPRSPLAPRRSQGGSRGTRRRERSSRSANTPSSADVRSKRIRTASAALLEGEISGPSGSQIVAVGSTSLVAGDETPNARSSRPGTESSKRVMGPSPLQKWRAAVRSVMGLGTAFAYSAHLDQQIYERYLSEQAKRIAYASAAPPPAAVPATAELRSANHGEQQWDEFVVPGTDAEDDEMEQLDTRLEELRRANEDAAAAAGDKERSDGGKSRTGAQSSQGGKRPGSQGDGTQEGESNSVKDSISAKVRRARGTSGGEPAEEGGAQTWMSAEERAAAEAAARAQLEDRKKNLELGLKSGEKAMASLLPFARGAMKKELWRRNKHLEEVASMEASASHCCHLLQGCREVEVY
eukprot:gene9098-10779_t